MNEGTCSLSFLQVSSLPLTLSRLKLFKDKEEETEESFNVRSASLNYKKTN